MSKTVNTRTRYKIIGSDFSAQEPRLTAFMSQDPAMIQAYNEGKDLYCVIAASMFSNKYEDNLEFYPEGTEIELDGKKIICGHKTHLHKAGKERRSAAKTMLLAILYGMSAATAGARMGKSADQGQELMDNFFSKFPRVKQLIDDSKSFLKKHGYVEDWAGRRRHLPEMNLPAYEIKFKDETLNESLGFNPFLSCTNREASDPTLDKWRNELNKEIQKYNNKMRRVKPNFVDGDEIHNSTYQSLAKRALEDGVLILANTGRRAQAERQCLNARIQGGAASLTKLAMVNIHRSKELKDLMAKLIITVHDEVLVECPEIYADEVEKLLPQVMIDTAKPYITVPMSCDPYNVSRWYCDEAGVSIRDEFKKLEKKGIERDEALKIVISNHPEFPESSIIDTITTGNDLEF
jgi:DNA polymerase I-like protein with 3'-5' exonuclease and polymerase domains